MKFLLHVAAALTFLGATAAHTASAQSFHAKLWVVPLSQASNVGASPPSAPEDVDFDTNGLAYIGDVSQPSSYTVGGFIGGGGTAALNVTYSGRANPNLGGQPVTASTAMSGSGYGVFIEFTGSVTLTNGQQIAMVHDDGVYLTIGGQHLARFSGRIQGAKLETEKWTGSSGSQAMTLLYANAVPYSAWLIFFPAL